MVLAILLLADVLYSQVLSFDYVWDDTFLVVENITLQNTQLDWVLLTKPVLGESNYIRPLVLLSWYFEFQLFGQSAAVSHIVNLLFFILNALLVFSVCKRIATRKARPEAEWLAFIAAVLYTVHPALVESTAWVSGRFDLMLSFFSLLMIFLYLSDIRPAWLKTVLVALCMLAATLCKEAGVLLPAILLCLWMACYGDAGISLWQQAKLALRANAGYLLAMLVVLLVYFSIRHTALGTFSRESLSSAYYMDLVLPNWLPLASLKYYLLKTFAPFWDMAPLSPMHELELQSWPARLGGLVALCFAIGVAVQACVRRSAAAWLMLAYLFSLLLVLYLFPIKNMDNVGSTRFLSLPLVFMVMAIVLVDYRKLLSVFTRLNVNVLKKTLCTILGIWVVAATFSTWHTVPHWKNDFELWSWAYGLHPGSYHGRRFYRGELLYLGKFDLLKKEFEQDIKENGILKPFDQVSYGIILLQQSNPEGFGYIEKVISTLPEYHKMPDGHKVFSQDREMDARKIGMTYYYYANALFMMRNDIAAAIAYNKLAEWYLGNVGSDVAIITYYPRQAFLYAEGFFPEADQLGAQLAASKFAGHRSNMKLAHYLLQSYCEKQAFDTAPCQELLERKTLTVEKTKPDATPAISP